MTGAKETIFRVKRAVFRIETARKITQFCCFVLFNAFIFGLGPWLILLPVLHSPVRPDQITGGDAFAFLQQMLHDAVFPWLPLAAFILTAVFLGRALCGWACPFGFIQNLLGYVKKKHTEVSLRTHERMIKVKYIVLAVTLFISVTIAISVATGTRGSYKEALGVFAPAPFNALSPADTLFATLPRIALDIRYANPNTALTDMFVVRPLLWTRLAIMTFVLILAAYVTRSWCRYFCPHAAALALLNRFSFLGLKRDPLKCTKAGCRACVEVCPMKIRILELPWEKFSDPECIYCLKCVEACTTKAIKPKFP
ncbi:MAG: quinol dehydrogenase membrane component [Candidatus Bathyarchaeota archaeon BA2]|nr:MAG: quinol dehydrogenase membrane component [Candidatus Bathyarchaeota archaeon BA2]